MNILHIDCSPRPASQSRKLSAEILKRIAELVPGSSVRCRDLGCEPIPHATSAYASILTTPEAIANAAPEALTLSESLIREIEECDVLVIGTPMNNFTVPSVLKAWIDQVLRMGRTIASTPTGKIGLIPDRPVLVAISSGGVFFGPHANQPDFLTPYLTAAFECIGLKTLHFFRVQATGFLDEETLAKTRAAEVASITPEMLCLPSHVLG